MHSIIGSATIVMGLIAAGIGVIVADRSIHLARRASRKTAMLSSASADSLGAWFLGGFTGVTMGMQWLIAVGLWLAWTVSGLVLMWLGSQLFDSL